MEITAVAILTVAAMATVSYLCRQDWLAPSAFSALVWSGYLTLALVGGGDYDISTLAMCKIVIFVLFLYLGAFVAEGPVGHAAADKGRPPQTVLAFSPHTVMRLLLISGVCTALSVAGVVYLAIFSLGNYGLGTSIDGLLGLGPLLSAERYVEGRYYPTIVRVLLVWIYPAALTAGIAFPC